MSEVYQKNKEDSDIHLKRLDKRGWALAHLSMPLDVVSSLAMAPKSCSNISVSTERLP
jgi:hypothetical protein